MKRKNQSGLLKESVKELFLNEAQGGQPWREKDPSGANNPGWFVRIKPVRFQTSSAEYIDNGRDIPYWTDNVYETRNVHKLYFEEPNEEWFAKGYQADENTWIKMKDIILNPQAYVRDFHETGERNTEDNFSRWPGFTKTLEYFKVIDADRQKRKQDEEEQKAKQAAERAKKEEETAVETIKQEIKDIQGFLADPDNQSEEVQNELKGYIKDAAAKLPAVKKLSDDIASLEEKQKSATGVDAFRIKAQIKQAVATKEQQIQAILDELRNKKEQVEAVVKESLYSERFKKLAGIIKG